MNPITDNKQDSIHPLFKNQLIFGYLDNNWQWLSKEASKGENIKEDTGLHIRDFYCWNKLRKLFSLSERISKILVKKGRKISFENVKVFGTLEIVS